MWRAARGRRVGEEHHIRFVAAETRTRKPNTHHDTADGRIMYATLPAAKVCRQRQKASHSVVRRTARSEPAETSDAENRNEPISNRSVRPDERQQPPQRTKRYAACVSGKRRSLHEDNLVRKNAP
jgi:hypothetical protein